LSEVSGTAKDALASRYARHAKNPGQLEKAVEAAFGGLVKRHTFLPSGRCVFTVVGSSSDEFVDPAKSFCSCESYFYSVLSAKSEYCYHLLAFKIAQETGLVREVKFDDEEYDNFLRLLAADVFSSREK
jgi:predicted nucleic acid-binding Zn finger protein